MRHNYTRYTQYTQYTVYIIYQWIIAKPSTSTTTTTFRAAYKNKNPHLALQGWNSPIPNRIARQQSYPTLVWSVATDCAINHSLFTQPASQLLPSSRAGGMEYSDLT